MLRILVCLIVALAIASPANATVGHSNLSVPCGWGVNVPVDWYFPSSSPTGLVWLTHGWSGQKADMGPMAQAISDRDNVIVVAPTISSSPLEWFGCWELGAPMQQAIASLFAGNRAALLASARAAGYQGVLPGPFVLAGHSAGGQLALAAAGYMVGTPTFGSLRAVVGLDAGGDLAQGEAAMAVLPGTLPIWNIASPVGQAPTGFTGPLRSARPGQFIGLQVESGCHLDATGAALGGSEWFLSWWFGCKLQPWNFAAYKTIVSGWILRALTGFPDVGIVGGSPGQIFTVDGAMTSVLP
jgi:hypothetical protein